MVGHTAATFGRPGIVRGQVWEATGRGEAWKHKEKRCNNTGAKTLVKCVKVQEEQWVEVGSKGIRTRGEFEIGFGHGVGEPVLWHVGN